MSRKQKYIVSFYLPDDREDIIEICAFSAEQAFRYGCIYCQERGYCLIAVELSCTAMICDC